MNSMFRRKSSNRDGRMWAFCAGLVIGGAAIVLWRPMRGRAIKRRLAASAQLGCEAVTQRVHKTAETAHSIVDEAKDIAHRGIKAMEDRASSAINAARPA